MKDGTTHFSRRGVLLLGTAGLAGCVSATAMDGTASAAGVALEDYVKRAGSFGFAGTVLGTRRGHVMVRSAGGFADISAQRENTVETLFDIGSLSKQFTAAAILKMEEDGGLTTFDTVGHHFPELPAPIAAVTLHQLLTHSSGLPWDLGDPRRPRTKTAFLAELGDVELAFPSGERFSYSNAGYTLLAAVVEEASGLPFENYLRDRLFLPAGMSATGYHTEPLPDHPAARGYLAGEDRGFPWEAPDNIEKRPSWTAIGAGSIISTAPDMDRWAAALISGRVLGRSAVARLFSCQIESSPGKCYSYGWNIEAEFGRRLVWHDGSNGSFWARLSIYPDEGVRVVTMSNKSVHHGWVADARARRALLGGPLPALPPRTWPLTREDFVALPGRYRFDGGTEIGFEKVGDDVFLEPRNGQALALLIPLMIGASRAAALTAAAASALERASTGDFEGLRSISVDQQAYVTMRENLEYLRDRGDRLAGFSGFGVIGTANQPTAAPESLATYGFADFGAGRAPIRLDWGGDRLTDIVIQTAAFVTPPRFAVRRLGADRLVGHSLALERSIEISLASDGTVNLTVDDKRYTGRKMTGAGM